jgi:formate hydrogenlyase subunit 3/multisubunit Na+/H+ antiporter MnhD subunit
MFTIYFLLVLFVLDGAGVLAVWFVYRRQATKKKWFVWGHICLSVLLVAVLVLYRATLSKNYINLATRHTVALS